MDTLRLERFKPLIGDTFSVSMQTGESLDFELIEVKELQGPAEHYECFSLSFRGRADQVIEQFSFPLNHKKLGEFHLFLVPYQKDETGTYYEAVVNRNLADLTPS